MTSREKKARYRDVLRARLIERAAQDVRAFLWGKHIRIRIVSRYGSPQRLARLRVEWGNPNPPHKEVLQFDYERADQFPSEKLLTQLMLVAP